MRAGRVAIIGRTNVGKSTFLNAVLNMPLAITSPLPQTTREEMLGVVRRDDAELVFVDTPGLHRPKTELGRRMNASALGSLDGADVVVFMTDVTGITERKKKSFLPDSDVLEPDDRRLLAALPADVPTLLVLNKVDLIRDKSKLLPTLQAFADAHPFKALVPVSVRARDDIELVLEQLIALVPEGTPAFEPDGLTDRPLSFFAREYVREQILLQTRGEVPHAVAVSIERFEQQPRLCWISATIHVEKPGQGSILVGRGGHSVKAIGTAARLRLEELLGTKVHLELFVRVSERWKNAPRMLSELGYEQKGRSLTNLLPEGQRVTRKGPPRRAKKSSASKGRSSEKKSKRS